MSDSWGSRPTTDGKGIRIKHSPLTEDREKSGCQTCFQVTPKGKVFLAQHFVVRRSTRSRKQKRTGLSEDQSAMNRRSVQKITDRTIAETREGNLSEKERDILKSLQPAWTRCDRRWGWCRRGSSGGHSLAAGPRR